MTASAAMDSLCSQCGATSGLPRFYAAFVLTRANTSGVQDGSPVNRCGRFGLEPGQCLPVTQLRNRSCDAIFAQLVFSFHGGGFRSRTLTEVANFVAQVKQLRVSLSTNVPCFLIDRVAAQS
jgi:hypothetical protein